MYGGQKKSDKSQTFQTTYITVHNWIIQITVVR